MKRNQESFARRFAVGPLLCVACLAVAAGLALTRTRKDPAQPGHPLVRPAGQLTFNKDIAPLVDKHCAGCHHPGESAPFSLLTYQDVKDHAADIVSTTGRRYMPPWLPDPGMPRMVGERGLTPDEIGMIRQWVQEGKVEGALVEGWKPQTWVEGWQLGPPDLVIEMPQAYPLAGGGRDIYRNFVIPISMPRDRFVKAFEFKAETKVLHHIFLRFDSSQQSRRLDEQDAEIGFGGMAPPPSAVSPPGHFLSWQPGRGPTRSPAGLAWVMPAKTDLLLECHMQPGGKQELVRPKIGFYFTDEAPTNTMFKIELSSHQIDIPAGSTNYQVQTSYVVPVDVDVLAVLPHAHYITKDIAGFAVLPGGETLPLLHIPDWDFNWQTDYRYQEPIHLPKGSRIAMRFTYDNSTQNVRNPNQPPIPVRYGLQSSDEMAELWLQLMPHGEADFRTLAKDYGRRAVDDIIDFNLWVLNHSPTNSHAQIQLGKALLVKGRTSEALEHLKRGVRLNPNDEEGQYHLGTILMDSSPQAAQRAFTETIRLNPDSFQARNNLGLLLMRSGRYAEAEEQFRTALKLNPGDAILLKNLELVQRQGTQR